MTSEMRHLIQMQDIRGVEISCKNEKCGAKVVISTMGSSDQEVPGSCPVCKHALFDPTKGTWDEAMILRRAIAQLARNQAENVRLEIIGINS